jgi:hypothetical protein
MSLIPLSDEDGSWAALKSTWRKECLLHSEDFDTYAQGTFAVLDPLAAGGHLVAGIYGLEVNGSVGAFSHAICRPLPGFADPVLSVHLTTFAPRYDFGDFDLEEYADLIIGLFSGFVELSNDVLPAQVIRFHFRSLADKQFFAALRTSLTEVNLFQEVAVKGMWMYVTKAVEV